MLSMVSGTARGSWRLCAPSKEGGTTVLFLFDLIPDSEKKHFCSEMWTFPDAVLSLVFA